MPSHVDLPQDVWTLVLQHVPLTHRLSSCALVCQDFKAAAVAATERIETYLFEQPAVDNFVAYLQQHGRHLTSLVLTVEGIGNPDNYSWPQLEQLPCQQLQELHVVTVDFGWGPDEERPSVLDNATAITHLELQESNFYLSTLSVLSSLQHLSLIDSSSLFDSKDKKGKSSAFAFSSLQQLTYLGLSELRLQQPTDVGLSGQNLDGGLCHISSITGLHTLRVMDCPELTSAVPGLSLPPSLQHLELCYTHTHHVCEPSVLAAATQLTCLILDGGHVEDEDEGGVSDGACLLEVLSKLQHLDTLRLYGVDIDWPPASSAYQALVASSSKLRVLQIECGLPDGACAHMFPSAPSHVVLPLLEVLGVSCIPPGAVAGVVRCCPALQQLTLWAEAPGCAHLAALSQLSALTRLAVFLEPEDDGGNGASTALSIQGLAGLSSLQDLIVCLRTEGDASCKDMLPLTALRQLTKLVGFGSYNLETQVGANCSC